MRGPRHSYGARDRGPVLTRTSVVLSRIPAAAALNDYSSGDCAGPMLTSYYAIEEGPERRTGVGASFEGRPRGAPSFLWKMGRG